MTPISKFVGSFGRVAAVVTFSYVAEYASFIIIPAFMSTKLNLAYNLNSLAYAIVGSVAGVYLIISGLIAVPIGYYADRYGRQKLTVVGCLLGSLALLCMLLIDRLPTLNMFLSGMFVSLDA